MRRLPSIALLVGVAGLTGCATHQLPERDRNPNKTFQYKDTAYIAVVLFKDASGTCKAKVSPETLLIVRKSGKISKASVEWEVVNQCWDPNGSAEEITIYFPNDPTERHATNPKEVATMPNSGANDKSRDQIRRKLKKKPGETSASYDYVIRRKIGTGTPQDVVDPRIEYEYR